MEKVSPDISREEKLSDTVRSFALQKRLHCFFLFPSLAVLLILKRFFKSFILFLKLLLIFSLSVSFNSVFYYVLHEKIINDIVS